MSGRQYQATVVTASRHFVLIQYRHVHVAECRTRDLDVYIHGYKYYMKTDLFPSWRDASAHAQRCVCSVVGLVS